MKLHRSFTHARELSPSIAENVRSAARKLQEHHRLGALLMQFPYGFTATGASKQHIMKLAEMFREFPLFVELRHNSWDTPALLPFLTEQGLRIANADMPKARQYMPFHSGRIGDVAYLRLHGRNEKGWLLNGIDVRYDYLYNGREMLELKRRCEALDQKARRAMVVFNATTGGKAVVNALQLHSALRAGSRLDIPDATLRTFPQLLSIALPPERRLSLFQQTMRTAS